MSEAILKSLKWFALVAFVIFGVSCFMWAEEFDTVKTTLPGILSFGVVYIMSSFWKEFRGKLLMFSVVVFLGLSVFARYIPFLVFYFFDNDVRHVGEFWTWVATVSAGVPIMTYLFHKYD